MQNGFNVVKKPDRKDSEFIVCCGRHRSARKSSATKYFTAKTKMPQSNDDCCPFRFNVKYNELHEQFYLFRNGCGQSLHKGHLQLNAGEMKGTKKILTEEEMKEVYEQLNNMLSSDIVKVLLSSKTGLNFDCIIKFFILIN